MGCNLFHPDDYFKSPFVTFTLFEGRFLKQPVLSGRFLYQERPVPLWGLLFWLIACICVLESRLRKIQNQ